MDSLLICEPPNYLEYGKVMEGSVTVGELVTVGTPFFRLVEPSQTFGTQPPGGLKHFWSPSFYRETHDLTTWFRLRPWHFRQTPDDQDLGGASQEFASLLWTFPGVESLTLAFSSLILFKNDFKHERMPPGIHTGVRGDGCKWL